jgi:hypothetical protein
MNIKSRLIKSWIPIYPERFVNGYTSKYNAIEGERQSARFWKDVETMDHRTPLDLRVYTFDILAAMDMFSGRATETWKEI